MNGFGDISVDPTEERDDMLDLNQVEKFVGNRKLVLG